MPLTFADTGKENTIIKIGGNAEMKQHLADLGFVVGGKVTVVSQVSGNLIVNVKNTRVALGKQMAAKIMI